jgi:hypothetical protein
VCQPLLPPRSLLPLPATEKQREIRSFYFSTVHYHEQHTRAKGRPPFLKSQSVAPYYAVPIYHLTPNTTRAPTIIIADHDSFLFEYYYLLHDKCKPSETGDFSLLLATFSMGQDNSKQMTATLLSPRFHHKSSVLFFHLPPLNP